MTDGQWTRNQWLTALGLLIGMALSVVGGINYIIGTQTRLAAHEHKDYHDGMPLAAREIVHTELRLVTRDINSLSMAVDGAQQNNAKMAEQLRRVELVLARLEAGGHLPSSSSGP